MRTHSPAVLIILYNKFYLSAVYKEFPYSAVFKYPNLI